MRVFVKISGDLLCSDNVVKWLNKLQLNHEITVCCGGGVQINQEFEARGYPIHYGPLGREAENDEQRGVATDVLKKNRAEIEALLHQSGVKATVVIPTLMIGGTECPVNGDLLVLTAYLGFDECFVLTLKSRVTEKQAQFSKYPRVHVIGF